jgi:hypothetical protein
MLDSLLAYLLVGLALMGLLELLSGLGKLRYQSLRAALEGLVAAAAPPKGFLSHVLVERALADPAVDPLSPGIAKEDAPVHPARRVTRIDADVFVRGIRNALGRTDVKLLVDGLSVRPEAVQAEVRQEVASLGDRVAASVSAGFDRAMAAAGERYARTMRRLAAILGVIAAALFLLPFAGALGVEDVVVLIVGVFLVPVSAGAWYGLLAGPMRLRPVPPASSRGVSSREKPGRSSSGRGGGRSGGGGGGRSNRSGPASSGEAEGGGSSGGGRSSGGGQRRRGRRSSGRRGGGNRSGGGKPSGGNGGGGSPAPSGD